MIDVYAVRSDGDQSAVRDNYNPDFHTCVKCQDPTTCIAASLCERDEAYKNPVTAKSYDDREAAFRAHSDAERFGNMGRSCNGMVLNAIRRAFNAGWRRT